MTPTAMDALNVQGQQGSSGSDDSAPKDEEGMLGPRVESQGQLESWSKMSGPSLSGSSRVVGGPPPPL